MKYFILEDETYTDQYKEEFISVLKDQRRIYKLKFSSYT